MVLVWRSIYPDTGLSHNILDTHFVANIDGDFPESFDGNLFLMFVMAIDGQEDIGDQSGQYLDHQSILAP